MLIAEIFRSRQGEGRLTGADSVFIRFSGCNLRCWFCDTPYTSWDPQGTPMTLEEVSQAVAEHSADHVVVTGGEPMLVTQLSELCHRINEMGRHITIETAGTIFQNVSCNLMSISPKLANSTPTLEQGGSWRARHEAARHRPAVVHRLIERYDYQLKFVVDKPDDLNEIDGYLLEFPQIGPERVWLMPQGIQRIELQRREEWLGPHCATRGFHLCERKHIEWYGNIRGT